MNTSQCYYGDGRRNENQAEECNDESQFIPMEQSPDFYQLQKILSEALKNIDEEKLYTKHIFDRFDLQALLMAVVRGGSYIGFIISFAYFFKRFQNDFYTRTCK